MIPRYQGAEGLGKSCPTLKKTPKHAHDPEVTGERCVFLTQRGIHGMPLLCQVYLTQQAQSKKPVPETEMLPGSPFFSFFFSSKLNMRCSLNHIWCAQSHRKLQKF